MPPFLYSEEASDRVCAAADSAGIGLKTPRDLEAALVGAGEENGSRAMDVCSPLGGENSSDPLLLLVGRRLLGDCGGPRFLVEGDAGRTPVAVVLLSLTFSLRSPEALLPSLPLPRDRQRED